jgi:hypothetical protein
MDYLSVALVSFALLLVNVGIGWALANKEVRAQIGPAVRRVLRLGRKAGQ